MEERTLLSRRKHWFVLISDLIGPVVLAALPFIIFPYVSGRTFPLGAYEITVSLGAGMIGFLASAWLLVWWMRVTGVWLDYYLDVWIITDKRLIDREQHGFFNRETATLRLERIQDVTVETRGVIPTFLHFGTIRVQTAGEAQEFIMHGIADPKAVRELILEAVDNITHRDTDSSGV